MNVSIKTFTRFPQGYNAVEADRSYTLITNFSRQMFNTSYGITVEWGKKMLESGLGLSMTCAYYCSRQNLSFRIGDNQVRTRDAYECVAAFWSHWRKVFTWMHKADNTQPEIEQLICNILMDGRED